MSDDESGDVQGPARDSQRGQSGQVHSQGGHCRILGDDQKIKWCRRRGTAKNRGSASYECHGGTTSIECAIVDKIAGDAEVRVSSNDPGNGQMIERGRSYSRNRRAVDWIRGARHHHAGCPAVEETVVGQISGNCMSQPGPAVKARSGTHKQVSA